MFDATVASYAAVHNVTLSPDVEVRGFSGVCWLPCFLHLAILRSTVVRGCQVSVAREGVGDTPTSVDDSSAPQTGGWWLVLSSRVQEPAVTAGFEPIAIDSLPARQPRLRFQVHSQQASDCWVAALRKVCWELHLTAHVSCLFVCLFYCFTAHAKSA